jgi:hypothetical protein
LLESNVDLNSIRHALREQPFRPFDLCLADGPRVPVRHPEFVAMNQLIVIVTNEDSETKILEPLLIESLEPPPGGGKRGHGSARKKKS